MDPFVVAQTTRLAGGAALVLLGIAVFAVGPKRRGNQGFALWAVGNGAWIVFVDLSWAQPRYDAMQAVVWPLTSILLVTGLILLARHYPERAGPGDGRRALAALGFAALVGALWFAPVLAPFEGDAKVLADQAFSAARVAATWGALLFFALRARHAVAVRSFGVMSIVVGLPAGLHIGVLLAPFPPEDVVDLLLLRGLPLVTLGALSAAWIRVGVARPGSWPFAVAWTLLGSALLSMVALASPGSPTWGYAQFAAQGVVRILGGAFLAYFIVRGQVEGLDSKVRWTIQRGTIAGFFVAAFFVATELAQQLLGERTGSVYIGIAVSGMLVFAISPMQRLAERVAAAAVPTTATAGAADEDVYRAAVRLAMRDRELTRDEERELVRLAERLGLGATRAMDIRDEIARERA